MTDTQILEETIRTLKHELNNSREEIRNLKCIIRVNESELEYLTEKRRELAGALGDSDSKYVNTPCPHCNKLRGSSVEPNYKEIVSA